MDKKQAKDYFVKGCNAYLELFCDKHGFDYEDAKESWVGREVGGITLVGDFYVDITTMIVDIEENAKENDFYEWYDYCLAANEFDLTTPNYSSWLRGSPRTDEKTFAKLREIKRNLDDCIKSEQIMTTQSE